MTIEDAVSLIRAAIEDSSSRYATAHGQVANEVAEGEVAINTLLEWNTLGHHVDLPVLLEFSETTGEDGLPLYERLVGHGNE
jgi:hypothetical protein